MPRGLPDYYNPDTLVSQRLANIEEIVTALRGVSGIDNRGHTLFYDDFHSNLSDWYLDLGEDGANPVISTARSYSPPSSCLLDAGTSGAGGDSVMQKHIQLAASINLGFEASFFYHEDAPRLRMDIVYNLAGDKFVGQLEIWPATGVIGIWATGGLVVIGNVGYNADSEGTWLSLKLVGDFLNGNYVRALIGQTQVDLSAYALAFSPVAVPDRAEFWLVCNAANAVTNLAYVGHAAGTVDEP